MTFYAVTDSNVGNVLTAGLVGVLLLAWSLNMLERRRGARLHTFAGAKLLDRLVSAHAPALRRPLNVMVLLGAVFLLLALAGPEWGSDGSTPGRGGREVLVLLDTSESMNAVNPAPNRLDRARRKITELLVRHPADRFGLVAFSGGAALQCPLTSDHGYFKTVLHAVDTDTLSEEGTDIESALREAATLFATDRARDGAVGRDARIVVLISDGEAVTGDALDAAEALAAYSHVMVLGIGDPGGAEISMPQWMRRGKVAPSGGITHRSFLDEESLSAIALAGDGVYVRSTLGDDDLHVIDRELAFLSAGANDESAGQRPVNRYRWPLAAAFILFALEGVWLSLLSGFTHSLVKKPAEVVFDDVA